MKLDTAMGKEGYGREGGEIHRTWSRELSFPEQVNGFLHMYYDDEVLPYKGNVQFPVARIRS